MNDAYNPRLCLDILRDIERSPFWGGSPLQRFSHFGDSPESVDDHILMLWKAGMVDGITLDTIPQGFKITRITHEGHEFLELSRNDLFWDLAVKRLGCDLSLPMIHEELKRIALRSLGS